jgi:hypothetical protein
MSLHMTGPERFQSAGGRGQGRLSGVWSRANHALDRISASASFW